MLPLLSSFYFCFPVAVAVVVVACSNDIGVSSGLVVVVLPVGVVVHDVKCGGS